MPFHGCTRDTPDLLKTQQQNPSGIYESVFLQGIHESTYIGIHTPWKIQQQAYCSHDTVTESLRNTRESTCTYIHRNTYTTRGSSYIGIHTPHERLDTATAGLTLHTALPVQVHCTCMYMYMKCTCIYGHLYILRRHPASGCSCISSCIISMTKGSNNSKRVIDR